MEIVMEVLMDKIQKNFDRQEEAHQFLKEQNQCPICSGDLDIYVECIPATYSIREEARCQSCMALSRVANHIIH